MKKILIFNGYYHPSKEYGGPITSIENVVDACCQKYEFYIVCYNHDVNNRTPFDVELFKWIRIGNANVFYVPHGFLDFSTKNNFAFLNDLKPDLIWFSGVLTPNNKLVTVKNARKLRIPVLLSPRGELSADRVKIKWYKKRPYLLWLRLFQKYKGCFFHGTSNDEIVGIKKFFSPDSDHIFQSLNISIKQQIDLFEYKKEKDCLKIIFYSRIHPVKNLLFAIKCLSKCRKNISFDIYGPIEDKNYWSSCQEIIDTLPSNVVVSYCGLLSNEDKQIIVQKHDCLLLPTLNENYGHAIAECLANSRPVIISKGTTPWDGVDFIAGRTLSLDDPASFSLTIDAYASMDRDKFFEIITSTKAFFKKRMDNDNAVSGHLNMFSSIIDNQ